MRQFDFLALIGVIAFTSSGFFVTKADARSLAEVTLESPFGPGWLLSGSMPASELDNVTDPIDYGPIGSDANDYDGTSSGSDLGSNDTSGNHTHCHTCAQHHHHHHNHTDHAHVDNTLPTPDGGQVGAPNPGAGDAINPFDYLEELYTNLTASISDLEDRVATLSDLESQLTDLKDTQEQLSSDV